MNQVADSDADLLGHMASQRDDPVRARDAWSELYSRHRRYLFVVARRAYGSFLGEEGTTDLVVDVFHRAFEWAGRQESPDSVRARFEAEDDDATRRQVLGWLGVIAERLFKDRFREGARSASRFDEYLEDFLRCEASNEDGSATENSDAGQMRGALATLDQLDQDVLRLSLPWYDVATRSFAVPRGEGAKLAALIGLSPDAFRQRRHRALRRIEQQLQGTEAVDLELGQ